VGPLRYSHRNISKSATIAYCDGL